MKIKCVKMQCPVCHITGSAQLFLNKNGEVRYARVRHYKGLNKFKKPQFDYHKIEDLETLKLYYKTRKLNFPQKLKLLGHKAKQWDLKPMTHTLGLQASFTKT